jgi:hypothetical protein
MPKVRLKFFEDPVERTAEEIAELRAAGLLAEDGASASAPATSGATATPAATPGDGKEKKS